MIGINVKPLFEPFRLGSLSLNNRTVMAPMTRNFSPEGVPGADVAAYYRRRAENGVGLIITEGTAINHPAAVRSPKIPRFHGDAALEGWSRVLAEVHSVGGKIVPQLWHVGVDRRAGDLPNPESMPISPSGLNLAGETIGEPMTTLEIQSVIEAFAQAAADAERLGFDGIELHGAHGYLIDQFFWHITNQRTDQYGGDLVERTRFAVEIIKACRRAVGPDFPIILRFSQWKAGHYTARLAETPEQLGQFLQPLSEAGVDIFHCSTRRFWLPEFEGSDLNLAGWTKQLTGKPTITVGSIGLDSEFVSRANVEEQQFNGDAVERLMGRLIQGEFDLVAVGRALIADPAWVAKLRDDRTDTIIPYSPNASKSLV